MSVVIETLVLCDDCGDQRSGDDRHKNAAQIRADRKQYDGWVQIGMQDYCQKCAPKHPSHKPFKIKAEV